MYKYIISEKWYGSDYGNFDTLDEAINELLRIKNLPYQEELDNEKEYEILKYSKGKLKSRKTILITSIKGNKWLYKGGGYI